MRDVDGVTYLLAHERQPNVTHIPQCTGDYGNPDTIVIMVALLMLVEARKAASF